SRANCSTSISIFISVSLGIFYFTRLTQNFERSHAYTDSSYTDSTNEFDLVYATNLTSSLGLSLAYAYLDTDVVDLDNDGAVGGSANFIRAVARYNF
ncbi:MAG: hypothetical protein ACYC04_09965, partial [Sulfurovum sp.]